jgi:hypothetical protein
LKGGGELKQYWKDFLPLSNKTKKYRNKEIKRKKAILQSSI